ncbi:hypothetical protein L1987_79132 [Smallanthus sonchifolius]|uniref:Uncharacterized protein n=1 Tax=Smallanthus sonchifolius TaxID=185202 RepID=A0ACB8ZFM5_9ASTR|nr:hypothetical protein L1987_79132 [Smallanthus sonchifolius]
MLTQKPNCADNCWNQQLDRRLLMESPPQSKLFSDDSSPSLKHPLSATSSSGGGSSVGDGGLRYIEHTVTKFDTFAGVAIKYGVEVADIKKMNGLTTDLQMFSRKTLHIPLPGRHPPSPIISNGHDIQGPKQSEIDLQNNTPETMLKPDTTSNTTTAFSAAAGKGLALRPKAASRTTSDADGLPNMPPVKLGDSVPTDTSSGVKKSSSSPSFQESYNNSNNCSSTSSIWSTSMLNLTADLQALSTAAITRPMFDGLPKPMSGRKNKAAID